MSLIVPGLGEIAGVGDGSPPSLTAPEGFIPHELVSLSLLGADGGLVDTDLTTLETVDLSTLGPVRAPMPYRNQRHVPSYYFSITEERHLYAESRLEQAWLLILDWSVGVDAVVTQPLTVAIADEAGEVVTHTPDFLILGSGAPALANVRPTALMGRPSFVRGAAVSGWLAERLGWQVAILAEPPALLVRNLRWLRGFARPIWGLEEATEVVVGLVRDDGLASVGAVLRARGTDPLTMPTLMHLLWHQVLTTALHRPIDHGSPLVMGDADDG